MAQQRAFVAVKAIHACLGVSQHAARDGSVAEEVIRRSRKVSVMLVHFAQGQEHHVAR